MNYFKNWHRTAYHARTKTKELSKVFPVQVSVKIAGDCEIAFTDEWGERISFFLDSETRLRLIKSLYIENKP